MPKKNISQEDIVGRWLVKKWRIWRVRAGAEGMKMLNNMAFLVLIILVSQIARVVKAGEKNGGQEFVEPIAIEETCPNDVGEYDIRLGVESWRNDSKDTDTRIAPRAQFFFGIIERVSGDINVPYLFREEKTEAENGIGDIGFGLKWLLARHTQDAPALVLGAEVDIATGDEKKELGEGKTEYGVYVASLKQFGSIVVQGNAAYSTVFAGEDIRVIEHALSAAFPLGRQWHFFTEYFGSWNWEDHESRLYLSPGIRRSVTKEIFFSVGLPVGMTTKSDDYGIILQAQYGF
ncbi:transporter [Elusimicrobiota bacterium]